MFSDSILPFSLVCTQQQQWQLPTLLWRSREPLWPAHGEVAQPWLWNFITDLRGFESSFIYLCRVLPSKLLKTFFNLNLNDQMLGLLVAFSYIFSFNWPFSNSHPLTSPSTTTTPPLPLSRRHRPGLSVRSDL